MEKDNWFKKKPEEDTPPEESPNKRRKIFHQDGLESQGNIQTDQTSSRVEEKDHAGSPSNHLDLEVQARDIKLKRKKPISPPTIGVMFVDQTPGGLLAKRLQ